MKGLEVTGGIEWIGDDASAAQCDCVSSIEVRVVGGVAVMGFSSSSLILIIKENEAEADIIEIWMASLTFKPLQHSQLQLSSFSHCKYSPALSTFKFHLSFHILSISPAKKPKLHLPVRARVASSLETSLSKYDINSGPNGDYNRGSSIVPSINKKNPEPVEKRKVVLRDRHSKNGLKLNFKGRQELGSDKKNNEKKINSWKDVNKDKGRSRNHLVSESKRERRNKKAKDDSPVVTLRVGLDSCSIRGDVLGAIALYELAKREGVKLGQYHLAVLLYLCSSAATGVVQPAKSGNSVRVLSPRDSFNRNTFVGEFDEMGKKSYGSSISSSSSIGEEVLRDYLNDSQTLDSLVQLMKENTDRVKIKEGGDEVNEIQVSEDVKRLALQKGFEIYNEMRMGKVPMNEATFTSVARMAMAFGDGDMAFDIVKEMKDYGINPRLRSYGPALATFCNNGDVEKAFVVEKHMLENGVYPEEPELETLLKVSIGAGKSDKVYYILHKLRTSVRQVSPATADLIEGWFTNNVALRVGKRKWNQELITKAMENGGGGWHGMGWLGTGKWTVSRSPIGSDGFCKCCGEKLVTIDLDPEETENFAKSVASIAAQREKNSSFQKFQKWLDYYGPFEAVVDGANVNAVVNGIRQMLPSRKWPLIILHNRRISGEKMDEPFNRMIIDKWKNADALYATPTGSNDDWYWLYAAIKCKCLLVTNDEMRDHLFQLLGNDFFPKWKERHQVRFSFTEMGPEFRMPPPCSVVIQESEKGHWHIPIVSEIEHEDQRIWLCCTRANSSLAQKDSAVLQKESHQEKGESRPVARAKKSIEQKLAKYGSNGRSKQEIDELHSNIKSDVSSPSPVLENHHSLVRELEAAEKLGACLIDFQI
ncbi:hypothetical protein RD792_012104 [Penstemon davidsonii]|uniref:ribonuclease P n=1 Tax=Penstemon davidsonii TaxID=160366 RepID=A0ABR0CXG9_9LAMI|nr:hypothetical protein RD792_012104 [Penstemon davidsonii]